MSLDPASIESVYRDPAWTFVASVAAVASLCVAIFIYRRGRTTKSLDYRIFQAPVVSVRPEAADRVEIFYDKQKVRRVHLIEVRLENTGTEAIRTSDYEGQIALSFGPEAIALTAEISRRSPGDLTPELTLIDNQVLIEPLLLNRGDFLTIKVLAKDFTGPVVIHARIVNIPSLMDAEVRVARRRKQVSRQVAAVSGLAAVISVVATVIAVASILERSDSRVKVVRPSPEVRQLVGEVTLVVRGSGTEICGRIIERTSRYVVVLEAQVVPGQYKRHRVDIGDIKEIIHGECAELVAPN